MAIPDPWGGKFSIGGLGQVPGGYDGIFSTVLRDGRILVTWIDHRDGKAKGQILNADGSTSAPAFDISVSDDVTGQLSVAATFDGNFIVSYDRILSNGNVQLLVKTFDSDNPSQSPSRNHECRPKRRTRSMTEAA